MWGTAYASSAICGASDKLGVEIAAMQEFESGSRRIGAARLCQVARILGVAPVGFFEGESTAMQDCADGGGVKGALAGIRRILSLEQLRLDALGSSLPDGLRRSEITDVLAVVAQLRDVLD
jgi:transcriptional regulator with XRE-family HTH domain